LPLIEAPPARLPVPILLSNRRALLFCAAVVFVIFATPAIAAPPDSETPSIEEVIVTAQRRDQRLQDVPISVTVVGEAQLEAANLASGTEIARLTPNLRVSNLGNEDQPKFSLRGVATPDFNLNTTSPIGVFYDGVFIASQFLGGPQLFDLDRVEVLRGPQGTLFGKNTTGGAINFISKAPTFEESGKLSLQVGNNSFIHADGALNLPLVDGKLAMRVAFNVSSSNGWVKNFNPAGQDLSSIDNHAVRLSLLYQPTDDFDATLRALTTRANPTNIGLINEGTLPGGLTAAGVNPRINPLNGTPFDNHEGYYDRTNGEIRIRGDSVTLNMNKHFDNVTATSDSNYTKGFFFNPVDAGGSIVPLAGVDFYADTQEWSEDLRFATDFNGPLNFIAGAYYGHDEVGIRTDWNFFNGALLRNQSYDQARTSYAAYADGTYDITAVDTLYAGIRWTHDTGEVSNFQVTGAGAPPILPQPTKGYRDSAPTGRAGVRHKFSDNTMGYVQYSRGYRSSAINGGALFNPNDFNVSLPETLDAYEIGLKTQFLDRRLTLNSSAFYYDYKNQQFINTVRIGQSNVVNAGAAQLYGLEVEAVAQVTPELTIRAGGSLLHTEYKQLVLNQIIGGVLTPVDLKGKQLIEAPHEEFTASLDYVRPVGSDARVGFHIDANHVGSEFYTPDNDPRARLPSFWESNARVSFGRDNWEVGAWVKNLNDNDVPGGVTIDTQTLFLILRTPVYPRRYGVEINCWF
jgi:iron complex outermembrane receptor protein